MANYKLIVSDLDGTLIAGPRLRNTIHATFGIKAPGGYYAHRNDSVEDLVHAVMTNTQMWGRDLTEVEGFEALTVKNLKMIREQGALAAYASCL